MIGNFVRFSKSLKLARADLVGKIQPLAWVDWTVTTPYGHLLSFQPIYCYGYNGPHHKQLTSSQVSQKFTISNLDYTEKQMQISKDVEIISNQNKYLISNYNDQLCLVNFPYSSTQKFVNRLKLKIFKENISSRKLRISLPFTKSKSQIPFRIFQFCICMKS